MNDPWEPWIDWGGPSQIRHATSYRKALKAPKTAAASIHIHGIFSDARKKDGVYT
jgi:hypothetical protein